MLQDAGVELANGEKLCDLDYTDHVECLFGCKEHVHHVPDRLVRAAAPFGMCFALRERKVLLYDWTTAISNLIFGGEELTIIDYFTQLSSSVMRDDSVVLALGTCV